jgi:hypothetical protein
MPRDFPGFSYFWCLDFLVSGGKISLGAVCSLVAGFSSPSCWWLWRWLAFGSCFCLFYGTFILYRIFYISLSISGTHDLYSNFLYRFIYIYTLPLKKIYTTSSSWILAMEESKWPQVQSFFSLKKNLTVFSSKLYLLSNYILSINIIAY